MQSGPIHMTEDETARLQRRHRLTGIGLMCAAVVAFACLDAIAKYLNGYMDTLQVVWARYTGGFILALLVSNPLSRPGLMRTGRPGLQILRAAMMLGSTVMNFMAFRYLQLDQSLSILFSTPFLVAILAGPILGEWIGWRRWVAILIGFAGVLFHPPEHFAPCCCSYCEQAFRAKSGKGFAKASAVAAPRPDAPPVSHCMPTMRVTTTSLRARVAMAR